MLDYVIKYCEVYLIIDIDLYFYELQKLNLDI